jgi:hypothetical protein
MTTRRRQPTLRFALPDLRLAAEQIGEQATFETLFARMNSAPTPTERQAYEDLVWQLDAELRAGITAGKYGLRLRWQTASAEIRGSGQNLVLQSYRPFDEAALADLQKFMAEHPEQCTQKGATAWAAQFIQPFDRDKVRKAARALDGYHKEKRGRKSKR